jgi:hypothetical protein
MFGFVRYSFIIRGLPRIIKVDGALALFPLAFAVLLLLTLQLFRFTGGLAAHCIDALCIGHKDDHIIPKSPSQPLPVPIEKTPACRRTVYMLDWARYPTIGLAPRLNEIV